MKKIKLIVLLVFFGLFTIIRAQCRLSEIKAFYYTPINGLDSINHGKVKISIFNAGDMSDWDGEIEYGIKGFTPNTNSGTTDSIHFNEENTSEDIFISNLEHDAIYDLYICNEYIGEFQDARELLKIQMDFEFKNNKLYYIPMYGNTFSDSVYGKNIINAGTLITENDESFLSENHIGAFTIHDLTVLREEIPFRISFDRRRFGTSVYLTIICQTDGTIWPLIPFYYNSVTVPASSNQWMNYEFNEPVDNYQINSNNSNYDLTEMGRFLFRFIPTISGGWGNSYLDNIIIEPDGLNEEICAGEGAWIYGNLETEEGIYLDTIFNSMGVLDSVVVTTLEFHPPLYVEEVSPDVFMATGNWDNYSWRSCVNDSIVELGSNFSPSEDGYYYVIASDNNCADTTECFTYGNPDIGIDENESFVIKIYPNPVNDIVNIDLGDVSATQIVLSDIQGKRLKTIQIEAGKSLYMLNVDKFRVGLYFVEIFFHGERIKTERLIIK